MKLSIYKQKEKEEKEEKKDNDERFLRLVEDEDYITLVVVDSDGKKIWSGNILHYHKYSKRICLNSGINPTLKDLFELDSNGRVVISN